MSRNKTHIVEIPEAYLLVLAAHGNMGDGEIPTTMRLWAEKQCVELGLQEAMGAERERNLRMLEARLTNLVGQANMRFIKREISAATAAIVALRGVVEDVPPESSS